MKTEVNNLMFKHIHTNKMGLCNSRKHMPLSRKGFFFRWLKENDRNWLEKVSSVRRRRRRHLFRLLRNSFNIRRETSFFGSVGLTGIYMLRSDLPDAKVLYYDEDIHICVNMQWYNLYMRNKGRVWKRHNYKNEVYFKCVRYDYDMRTRGCFV